MYCRQSIWNWLTDHCDCIERRDRLRRPRIGGPERGCRLARRWTPDDRSLLTEQPRVLSTKGLLIIFNINLIDPTVSRWSCVKMYTKVSMLMLSLKIVNISLGVFFYFQFLLLTEIFFQYKIKRKEGYVCKSGHSFSWCPISVPWKQLEIDVVDGIRRPDAAPFAFRISSWTVSRQTGYNLGNLRLSNSSANFFFLRPKWKHRDRVVRELARSHSVFGS